MIGYRKMRKNRIQEEYKNTIIFPKKTIQITQNIIRSHNHTINISETPRKQSQIYRYAK